MSSLSIGYAFARSSFQGMLAHRMRYLLGVTNYIVYAAVQWYLWEAVYYGQRVVAGWELAELQSYSCLNWIARCVYFSNSDSVLAGRINSGQIVSELLRPASLLLQFYSSALGEMLFRFFFMGLPSGILIYLLFGMLPPASFGAFVLFVFSLVLAFHLFFAINFLCGLAALLTDKAQGFLWAKFVLLQFLAGQTLPLEFFPGYFREALEWMPFKGIAHTPMSLYLGRFSRTQAIHELILQAAWTAVLMLLCVWAWSAARRRLTTHGG